MNGLANAILTLLLSWLRMIVNRIWSLVSSDTGSLFFTFLSKNWPTILLVLVAGGFLLDKIIYLIRWRPFSVRRRRREQAAMQQAPQLQETYWPQQPTNNPYARPAEPVVYANPVAEQEPDMLFDPEPPMQQSWSEPAQAPLEAAADQTAIYSSPVLDHSAYRPPMEDIDPVFDDQAMWAGSDALVGEPGMEQPVAGQLLFEQPVIDQPTIAGPVFQQPEMPVFEQPVAEQPILEQPTITMAAVQQPAPSAPVTDQYMQDVNAGFARPVAPEQLYAQPQQPYPAPGQAAATLTPLEPQPVHPGLNAEHFRRSLGLSYNGEPEENQNGAHPITMNFTPFTKKAEPEQPAKKGRNPFLNLMRLVGDEAAKPSIHDLQSNVDVREAFREPVYPKPLYRNEDDPS